MTTLAKQFLALALCFAIPVPPVAAQIVRGVPPAARVSAFQTELSGLLDRLVPPSFSGIQALRELQDARLSVSADDVARRGARAFLARALTAEAAEINGLLSRVDLPRAERKRLLAAAAAVDAQAKDDPILARLRQDVRSDAALESVADIPWKLRRERLNGLVERARGFFAPAQSGAEALVFAESQPPSPNPGDAARGVGLSPAAPSAPVSAAGFYLVPSSKKVAELESLARTDPEKGYAAAAGVLDDPAEKRVEVRVAALRIVSALSPEKSVPLLTGVVDNDASWYVKREAARLLGRNASALGALRERAEKSLRGAFQSDIAGLRLMAGWALGQMGIDPGPEPKTKVQPKPSSFNQISRQAPAPSQQPRRVLTGMILVFIFVWLAAGLFGPLASQSRIQGTRPAAESVVAPETAPVIKAPEDADLKALREIALNTERSAKAVETMAKPKPTFSFGAIMMNAVMIVALILGMGWLMRKMSGGPGGGGSRPNMNRFLSNDSMGYKKLVRPETRFSDVAGIDDAMVEIQEIVDFLRNPERYARMGGNLPKGVLLEGPPGTGKTLLARALAGESSASFLQISGSDFIEMFVGVGASRVRQLFEEARKNAPSVIFIDEIDAVGKARGQANVPGGHDEREQTINALLKEMDGFDSSGGVIILAATNRIDMLDKALTRPGRFDRKIHVGLPDVRGREAILQVHAKSRRLGPAVDLQLIAQRTPGLSGAFLENIVNEASLLAVRRGGAAIEPRDMDSGVDRTVIGQERNLLIPEADKKRVSYHESGHALVQVFMKNGSIPARVTVIPRGGGALGFTDSGAVEDSFLMTEEQLNSKVMILLGGYAAEKLIYGNTSTGPSDDLPRATELERAMVEKLGMSEKMGLSVVSADRENPFGGRTDSEQTRREIDLEVKERLQKKYDQVLALLTERRAALEAMSAALMARETLTQEEIREISSGAPSAPSSAR